MVIDCSFPRAHRLLRGPEFQAVFKQTRCRSADKFLCILAIPNNAASSRLGLAIAKKKIRTAVGRQRIKRLVRESFRLNRRRLGNRPGLDIVVMANPAAANATNQQLFNSLNRHWEMLTDRCNR